MIIIKSYYFLGWCFLLATFGQSQPYGKNVNLARIARLADDLDPKGSCAVTQILQAMNDLLVIFSEEIRELKAQVKSSCSSQGKCSGGRKPVKPTRPRPKPTDKPTKEEHPMPEEEEDIGSEDGFPDDLFDIFDEDDPFGIDEPEPTPTEAVESENDEDLFDYEGETEEPVEDLFEGLEDWWGNLSPFAPKRPEHDIDDLFPEPTTTPPSFLPTPASNPFGENFGDFSDQDYNFDFDPYKPLLPNDTDYNNFDAIPDGVEVDEEVDLGSDGIPDIDAPDNDVSYDGIPDEWDDDGDVGVVYDGDYGDTFSDNDYVTTPEPSYLLPPEPIECSSPFNKEAGGCYLIFSDQREWKTWGAAQGFCQGYGGQLASPWRFSQLQDYLSTHYSDAFWVGARLDGTTWKWLSDREIDRHEWRQGQPDRHPGKQCIFLDSVSGYKANNFFCGEKYPFICEPRSS